MKHIYNTFLMYLSFSGMWATFSYERESHLTLRNIVFMNFAKFSPKRAHLYIFSISGGGGKMCMPLASQLDFLPKWSITLWFSPRFLECVQKTFCLGAWYVWTVKWYFKLFWNLAKYKYCEIQKIYIFCLPPSRFNKNVKKWSWP